MLNEMATMMNKKFDKYWGNVEKMNHMMFLGLVLDPRYKLDYLALAFKCIYTDSTSVMLLKGVEDTLRRLYKNIMIGLLLHLWLLVVPPPNSTKQPQSSQLARPQLSPSTITASSEPASMSIIDDEIEAM